LRRNGGGVAIRSGCRTVAEDAQAVTVANGV
jgi:hypothetical protein